MASRITTHTKLAFLLAALAAVCLILTLRHFSSTSQPISIIVDGRTTSVAKVGDLTVELKNVRHKPSGAITFDITTHETFAPGRLPVLPDMSEIVKDAAGRVLPVDYNYRLEDWTWLASHWSDDATIEPGKKSTKQTCVISRQSPQTVSTISVTKEFYRVQPIQVRLENISPSELPISRNIAGVAITVRQGGVGTRQSMWPCKLLDGGFPSKPCFALEVTCAPGMNYEHREPYPDVGINYYRRRQLYDPNCTLSTGGIRLRPDDVLQGTFSDALVSSARAKEPPQTGFEKFVSILSDKRARQMSKNRIDAAGDAAAIDKHVYVFRSLKSAPKRFSFEVTVPRPPGPQDRLSVTFRSVPVGP